MDEKAPKNFLREWREHRRMTQAALAEKVGTTGAVISLLESGHRGLTHKWLNKLADALGTRPGHILEIDPNDSDGDLLEIWAHVPDESRPLAKNVLRTFTRETPATSGQTIEIAKPKEVIAAKIESKKRNKDKESNAGKEENSAERININPNKG